MADKVAEATDKKSSKKAEEKVEGDGDGVVRKRTDDEVFSAAFRIDNIRALMNRLEKHDGGLSAKQIEDKNHRALMAYWGLSEKEHAETLRLFGLPYDVDKDMSATLDADSDVTEEGESMAARREREDSMSIVKLFDRLNTHDARSSEIEVAHRNHRTLLKFFGLSEKEDGAMLKLFGLPHNISEEPGSADGISTGTDGKSSIDGELVVAEGDEQSLLTLLRRMDKNDVNLSDKKIGERNHRLIMTFFGLSEKEDGHILRLFGLPYNVDRVVRTDQASKEIVRKYNDEVENSAREKRPSVSTLLNLLDDNHPDSSENEIVDKNHRMMMTYYGLNEEDHGPVLKLFGLKFSTPEKNSENEKNSVENELERIMKNGKKSSSKMFPFLDSTTGDPSLTDSARRLQVLEKRKAELVWEANKYKAEKAFKYVAKSVTETIGELIPKKVDSDDKISKNKSRNAAESGKKSGEDVSDIKDDKP